MFGIDGPEFVIILIVLIVVVGPKELPKMLRALGKITSQLRKTANDFRRQFNDAMREVELEDVQKTMSDTMSDIAELDPKQGLVKNFTSVYDPLREAAKGIKADLNMQNIFKGSPKIVENPVTEKILDNAAAVATVSANVDDGKLKAVKKTTVKKTPAKTATAKKTPKKTIKSNIENATVAQSTVAQSLPKNNKPKNNRKTQS